MKKLLAVVLTSSKIHLMRRAVDSIKRQFPVKAFTYDIMVIVNTKNKGYYEKVVENITEKDIKVINTKSNGYPGMGHNSCLRAFKERTEYDYLTILDGDDLYYPCAFQRFEKMMEQEPDLDLVHLMLNDRVHFQNPEKYNAVTLKKNYKLISSFEKRDFWWKTVNTTNPMDVKIADAKTPSRILLVSRKIFTTTHPIEYSENMQLYDDMVAFFSFYEAEMRKEIKTFASSDTYIYLYNSLNDHSSSYNFSLREREDKLFKQEVQKYTECLKHNWKLSELPFLKIKDDPENFTYKDRVNYCNKYVVDFDLAHMYTVLRQYKLDTTTSTEFDIEKIYTQLLHVGMDTPDNLLALSQLFLKQKNMNAGTLMLMRLVERHPTSTILKKIMIVFYQYKLYHKFMYFYTLYKSYNVHDEEIEKLYNNVNGCKNDNEEYISYNSGKLSINFDKNKEFFCYYTGYTSEFDGSNYQDKNVYGSEIAAIKLCEQMTDKYNVVVFGTNTNTSVYNNVYYLNANNLRYVAESYKIKHFVISRFIAYTMEANLMNIENIYFIMHDARVHDMWGTEKIPLMGFTLFQNFLPKLRKIICVSEWQKNNFRYITKTLAQYEIPDEKFVVLNNGINTSKFIQRKKRHNSFISCSDPSRGLEMTCAILVELQKKFKDVTLDIYFSTLPNNIKVYVDKYSFINFHGKVSNDKIIEAMATTEYFLYTNINSHETFCISILEAMCSGCVVLTRDYSGPPELLGDAGVLIPEKLKGDELKKYTLEKLTELIKDKYKRHLYVQKARKRAQNYDWANIAKYWCNMLEE